MFLLIRIVLNVLALYYGIHSTIIAGRYDSVHGVMLGLGLTLMLVILAQMLYVFIAKEYERYFEWRESHEE